METMSNARFDLTIYLSLSLYVLGKNLDQGFEVTETFSLCHALFFPPTLLISLTSVVNTSYDSPFSFSSNVFILGLLSIGILEDADPILLIPLYTTSGILHLLP